MAKHLFKLQQVLNYRKEIEKLRKQEFAEAKSEYESAADRLQREEEETMRLAVELTERQSEGILANEFQMYAQYFQKKDGDIKNHRVELDDLNQVVAKKREHLLDAAKDKKVLETFKERQYSTLMKELAGKERNFLDEIAIQKKDHTRS